MHPSAEEQQQQQQKKDNDSSSSIENPAIDSDRPSTGHDSTLIGQQPSSATTLRDNEDLCCDTNISPTTTIENISDKFVSKEQIKAEVYIRDNDASLQLSNECYEEDYEKELAGIHDISWKAKAVILTSMLIMPVGCHYMEATLGTLKTTLKTSMDINNTQFSILMSAVSVVNTILPFFAGAFADDFNSSIGSVRGTLITSIVIFIGSLLVSIALNLNNYPLMVAGQVIYGLGDGVIVTFQEAILSRWFRDKQLSIVVGIMLSMARLTKFIAKVVCYPLADYAGTTTRPVTVAMILCALSVLANVAYWCVMVKQDFATLLGKEKHSKQTTAQFKRTTPPSPSTYVEKANEDGRGRNSNSSNSTRSSFTSQKPFVFHYSTLLYLPGTFWMMPWLQFTMSSVLSSFADIATEFVQFRFKTTRVRAGYLSGLTQLAPIVLAPLLGLYAHRYGKRLYMLLLGILVLFTGLALLAYTGVSPVVGMMFVSTALSLGPVAILSSSALLVPAEMVGVAIGLHKCSNNIGSTILSVIVGYLQDLTFHDGDASDDTIDTAHEYDRVMNAYLGITLCALVLGVCFLWLDKNKLSGWLQVNRKERERRLNALYSFSEKQEKEYLNTDNGAVAGVPATTTTSATAYTYAYNDKEGEYEKLKTNVGSKLRRKRTYIYLSIYLLFLLDAWVVFFTFVLMPLYQHYEVN